MMPHTEGKVVDRAGKTVTRGETGELLVRGTNIFIGYWNDKNKTRNVFHFQNYVGDIIVVDRCVDDDPGR